MKKSLLMLTLLLSVSTFGSGDKVSTRYISYCEIVRHPEKYDQQIVLTSGVVEYGVSFFDPACKPQPNPNDLTLAVDGTFFDLLNAKEGNAARKRFDNLLGAKESVFVVVEARFDAYKRYTGPLPKDERLQELLKKGNARFGHDNCCRSRLAIKQVMLAVPARAGSADLRF